MGSNASHRKPTLAQCSTQCWTVGVQRVTQKANIGPMFDPMFANLQTITGWGGGPTLGECCPPHVQCWANVGAWIWDRKTLGPTLPLAYSTLAQTLGQCEIANVDAKNANVACCLASFGPKTPLRNHYEISTNAHSSDKKCSRRAEH